MVATITKTTFFFFFFYSLLIILIVIYLLHNLFEKILGRCVQHIVVKSLYHILLEEKVNHLYLLP